MSIFDNLNYFWLKNENDPCSLSEVTLYFYLMYEANRQHWLMPFKVSTQMLIARLNTTKQNVMKARDGLKKRGLIDFVRGEGKGKPAMYTFCLSNSNENVVQTLSLTQSLSPKLTPKLPQTLPLLNNKEEIHKEVVKEDKYSFLSKPKKVLPIDEMQAKLLADTEWLNCLSKNLSSAGINLNDDELKGNINDFFDSLRSRNITHKEETDCRGYIYNWIKYHKKNNNDGQDSRNKSKSGRINITDNRPEDYAGLC